MEAAKLDLRTSKVFRIREGSPSLRTTLPEVVVDLLKLQHGDELAWDYNVHESKVIITVDKAQKVIRAHRQMAPIQRVLETILAGRLFSIPMGLTHMARQKRDSVEFEDYIGDMIRRDFPAKLGWKIDQERVLNGGRRVDFALPRTKYGKNERAVVEAKNVAVLTTKNVEQLDDYARRYRASHRQIIVPMGTEIDKEARYLLDDLDIKLRWTRSFGFD